MCFNSRTYLETLFNFIIKPLLEMSNKKEGKIDFRKILMMMVMMMKC